MDTVSMLQEIRPRLYSPAFYTPHPGSDLYDYCIENDLSPDHQPRSVPGATPWETKVKGQELEFLQWALKESQRRKPINALRRRTTYLWAATARPDKAVRRLKRLLD